MAEIRDQRISDSLYLLSRGNFWDSVKIVYDILINEVFLFAKTRKGQHQHVIEEKGKDIMCLLHEFLLLKGVQNIDPILSEIRLLTIFFNNYSRENLKVNANNHKLQVLTLNLIGLVKYLAQPGDSKYFFGRIDSELAMELQNNITEELYNCTTPYFEIMNTSMRLNGENFWEHLEDYEPVMYATVFSEEEHINLTNYKNIIDNYQFRIPQNQRNEIEEIWQTYINLDEIIQKIELHYHLLLLTKELETFRRSDISSGKYSKNIYRTELEEAFHKNVYPYLTNCSLKFDLVLSELNSGSSRHDIVLYKQSISLSAILELKVNKLDKLSDDLLQLERYLNSSDEKSYHYMKVPTFGILAIYYIGEISTLQDIDVLELLSDFNIVKKTNSIYYYLPEFSKPIIIALFNGKN